MCASMKPGTTNLPAASIVSRPSYSPTPAIHPSASATSASSHSRVNTERTRPPFSTRSAGSSPRATAIRRARSTIVISLLGSDLMEVLTPHTLDEALRLRADIPGAVPIEGGTDLMVDLNFDRRRPEAMLNLNEVHELRGWSRENGSLRLGAGLTFTEIEQSELASLLPALAEAARTVGSPQIRNRGTIGGNLGTASPARDALPPLLIEAAQVELANVRGTRRLPLAELLVL